MSDKCEGCVYCKMSVKQLKKQLLLRGLSIKGDKDILADRLLDYEDYIYSKQNEIELIIHYYNNRLPDKVKIDRNAYGYELYNIIFENNVVTTGRINLFTRASIQLIEPDLTFVQQNINSSTNLVCLYL